MSSRVKPLIAFTPKSMLRLKTGDLAGCGVHCRLLPPGHRRAARYRRCRVRTVLLCTGKIYYDLAAKRQAAGLAGTAIVRVERLYPLPADELLAELSRYPAPMRSAGSRRSRPTWAAGVYALHLPELLRRPVRLASLPASSLRRAAPLKAHATEHAELIDRGTAPGPLADVLH